ncbi:MAG: hypothetical protein IT359_13750 [Gemmatimonadaceae bacterium]|nr:hypothetical protein [Gemmatimonadaceae bacterium]
MIKPQELSRCFAMLMVLAACSSPTNTDGVRLRLEVESSVQVVDSIAVRAVVTNSTGRQLAIGSESSPPIVNVEVRRSDGRLVWNRVPPTAMIGGPPTTVRLVPEQEWVIPVVWRLVDDTGLRVQPGEYTMRAVLRLDGSQVRSQDARVVVTPS